MITPEQLEQQIQTASSQRESYRKVLTVNSADTTLDIIDESTSLEKLNLNLLTRIESFKYRALEEINSLATKLNIPDLTTPNLELPKSCPTEEILQQISSNRDNLTQDLQKLYIATDTIRKSLEVVNRVVESRLDAKIAIQTLKTATSLASKTLPALPGAAGALLSDLEDIIQQLTFDVEGKPRIPRLKSAVTTGLIYTDTALTTISLLINNISIIDTVLSNCNQKVTPIPDDIVDAVLRFTQKDIPTTTNLSGTTYKGFIFEIVEIPFRNTLIQRKAVAKNKFGVTLLETGLSFTTDPQVLINELELIIDRDNLKAN